MTFSEIATSLAGLFAGTTLALLFVVNLLISNLRKSEAERKRWVNKVMVRDGHAQVFPDSEIEPELASKPETPRKAPLTMVSPFQRGLRDLKSSIADGKQEEAGANVPEPIKEKIADAAAKARGDA